MRVTLYKLIQASIISNPFLERYLMNVIETVKYIKHSLQEYLH